MQARPRSIELEDVRSYRRDGFVVLRELFDHDDLEQLRDMVDNLSQYGSLRQDRFADRLVVVRNLWQHDERAAQLIWKIAPLASQLIGCDAVRLIDDVTLIKPARQDGGSATNWHQDAPNFPFDRRGFLTFWIALEDIAPEQGALSFLTRSHRIGLLGAIDGAGEDVPVEQLLTADDLDRVGEPVVMALQAGDATVHDGATLHAAGPNRTERPRRAWGVRFVPADTLYTGGAHRSFDGLGLAPFMPLDHPDFPLMGQRKADRDED